MKNSSRSFVVRLAGLLGALVLVLSAPPAWAGRGRIVINNVDPPGVGFNDPTPRDPIGGNPGTTVGEQRLNVFNLVADFWTNILDTDVDIVVQASFSRVPAGTPLPFSFDPNPGIPFACQPFFALVALTGTSDVFANFPGAPRPNTWYPGALANALAGQDLSPGPNDTALFSPPYHDEFITVWNPDLDNPDCLLSSNYYYGFDGNNVGLDLDLVNQAIHEFAHGLGFVDMYNEITGRSPEPNLPTFWGYFTYDNTLGLHFSEMTDQQRIASAVNCGNVVWDGPITTSFVESELDFGTPTLEITSPASIAGKYLVETAQFGAPLSSPGVSGSVVVANDGVGVASDACEPLSSADVSGKIVVADRGGCVFSQKMNNVQAAGGTATLIAVTNSQCPAPPLGGTGPAIIPVASITRAVANAIRGALAQGVTGTIGLDMTRRAGTDEQGRALIWAADPVGPGGSITHLDPIDRPNQMMEPFQQLDTPRDPGLGLRMLQDTGWKLRDTDEDGIGNWDDHCPDPEPQPTVVIQDCNSHVPNLNLDQGCRISNSVTDCLSLSADHETFETCVKILTKELQRQGLISGQQRSRINKCARESDLPGGSDDDSDSDSH